MPEYYKWTAREYWPSDSEPINKHWLPNALVSVSRWCAVKHSHEKRNKCFPAFRMTIYLRYNGNDTMGRVMNEPARCGAYRFCTAWLDWVPGLTVDIVFKGINFVGIIPLECHFAVRHRHFNGCSIFWGKIHPINEILEVAVIGSHLLRSGSWWYPQKTWPVIGLCSYFRLHVRPVQK